MPPENRKPPAGTGGVSESDLLTGDPLQSSQLRSGGGTVPVAEAAAVGALILGPAQLILDIVTAEDFADRRCGFVVSTAARMASDGVPIDQVTLPGYVTRHALLQHQGPRFLLSSFLHEMVESAPVPASGAWYAAQVVEAAVRRRVGVAGQRISRAAEDGALAELRSVLVAELAAAMAELDRAELDRAEVSV